MAEKRPNPTVQQKFLSKVTSIGNINILEVATKEANWSDDGGNILPAITYCDIVNYVASHPSPYTLRVLKFYKDLDAYKRFLKGYVREVSAHEAGKDRVIVRGRVMLSEEPRDADLRPLIVAQKDGVIINSHCKCTSGLEKMCTHRLSLLFWLETKVRIRDQGTVPRMPASMDETQYDCPIHQLDFSSEKSKKRKQDDDDSLHSSPEPLNIPAPTQEETNKFLEELHKCGANSVIFSVLPGYCKSFIPKESKDHLKKDPSDTDETDNVASSSSFSGHDSPTKPISPARHEDTGNFLDTCKCSANGSCFFR